MIYKKEPTDLFGLRKAWAHGPPTATGNKSAKKNEGIAGNPKLRVFAIAPKGKSSREPKNALPVHSRFVQGGGCKEPIERGMVKEGDFGKNPYLMKC